MLLFGRGEGGEESPGTLHFAMSIPTFHSHLLHQPQTHPFTCFSRLFRASLISIDHRLPQMLQSRVSTFVQLVKRGANGARLTKSTVRC